MDGVMRRQPAERTRRQRGAKRHEHHGALQHRHFVLVLNGVYPQPTGGACTDLARFLLARALDRRKEIAVCLALGASRGSLVRRLLTETTLPALLAGGAGAGLAVWLLDLLATADLPLPIPVALDLRLDGRALAFTLGVSVVAGALLAWCRPHRAPGRRSPARCAARARGADNPGRSGGGNALVVAQLTISLVLLVGAGLFLRSFQQGQSVDAGFAGHPLLARRGPRLRAAPARPLPRAAPRRGGRRDQQPAPEPAQAQHERLQRRWLRAAERSRRLHREPGRGRL